MPGKSTGWDSEHGVALAAAFDADPADALADFEMEDDKENRINGASEFGYGMWTRWSRVFPKDIASKQDWYTVARFTTNRNHNDVKNYGDRALSIFLGKGVYHFVTYSIAGDGGLNVFKNLVYDNHLEGQWNYIWYGY
jgi:hypothetical protein